MLIGPDTVDAPQAPPLLPILAVIVPCYNEQDVLPHTLESLLGIVNQLVDGRLVDRSSYIVCVDDGASDATWDIIARHHANMPGRVKGIKLSRNFGHQNALLAGLMSSDFDASVSIDADMQDPPEVIIDMVKQFANGGYDIVYGARSERATDGLFKRTSANGFYRLMRALGVNLVMEHADFRLLSRRAVQALSQFKEYHLFLRGIIPYIGYASTVVYYARAKRKAGITKYPLRKMLAFAWNGITSCSIVPLSLITLCGFLVCLVSLIFALWLLLARPAEQAMPAGTTLAVIQYVLSGLTIVFTGIVGQYVGRVYQEVKQRPRFIIEKTLPDHMACHARNDADSAKSDMIPQDSGSHE